jgi:hypothetical protein
MVGTKASKRVLMDAGFLAPLIAEFASSLKALAHSDLTIGGYTDSGRHFAASVCETGLKLDDLGKGTLDDFAHHHCRCAGGCPIIAQTRKPTIDGLPRRKVGGEQAPRDLAPQGVEDRIHDLTRRPCPRTPDRRRKRQQARDQRPFRIRQVGLVSVRDARMLRAGGCGPHGDLRKSATHEITRTSATQPISKLNPFRNGLLSGFTRRSPPDCRAIHHLIWRRVLCLAIFFEKKHRALKTYVPCVKNIAD